MTERPAVTAIAALLFLVVFTACAAGGSNEPREPDASSASSTTSGKTQTKRTVRPMVEIAITIRDRTVVPPPSRIEARRGRVIRLVVTSDVADSVHVHGYDLVHPLPAGTRTTLEWVADQVGVFEIEAHESKLQLAQLEVR